MGSARLTLDPVESAIAFDQPKLVAFQDGRQLIVQGTYLLFERGGVHPDGPMTEFAIKMEVLENYPKTQPLVFEMGKRIPRISDRHVNPDGSCCVTVWEHWLTCTEDNSFQAYLNGPLHEFFLSQYLYENTGRWPFGERSHGCKGLVEAYAEALGVDDDADLLLYYLRILSKRWPKGHWLCPCGSKKVVRRCHKDELASLHAKISPEMATRMLRQVRKQSALNSYREYAARL